MQTTRTFTWINTLLSGIRNRRTGGTISVRIGTNRIRISKIRINGIEVNKIEISRVRINKLDKWD